MRTWASFSHAIFLTQRWDEIVRKFASEFRFYPNLNWRIWKQIAITEFRLLNKGGKFIETFICFAFLSFTYKTC